MYKGELRPRSLMNVPFRLGLLRILSWFTGELLIGNGICAHVSVRVRPVALAGRGPGAQRTVYVFRCGSEFHVFAALTAPSTL